jgi:DedD protein
VNRSYDRENDLQDLHEPLEREREISLGTSMILGIFFVLALLCAIFFGFGYSMGRRSAQPVAGSPEASAAASSESSDSTDSKPSPGSLANRPASQPESTGSANDNSSSAATNKSPNMASRQDSSAQAAVNPQVKVISLPRPAAAAAKTSLPAAVPGLGSVVVQIAAVSHQEDADALMNALKKRGYSVNIRQEPQDKLLHVQIGPYATKKDAEVMRQKLQADGYNAIVK